MPVTFADVQAILSAKDTLTPVFRSAAQTVQQTTQQIDANLKSVSGSVENLGMRTVVTGNIIAQQLQIWASRFANVGMESIHLAARHQQLIGVSQYMTSQQGLSAAATDRLAKALNKQGITLNESRQAIIRFSQAGLDLNRVQALGTVAQSAARIAQENSSETLARLIQGIQTLQPEVLRTAGIVVNTQKAFEDWATATGKNANALSMAERQQAMLNAVIKEGEKIAGVYAKTQDYVAGREQSLKRYREDAYNKIGEAAIPIYTKWIDLQIKLYKLAAEFPRVAGLMQAAVYALAVAFGGHILGLDKYVRMLFSAGKAALVFAAQMAVATKAQLAQNAAQAQAAALAAMPKQRMVGFGAYAASAAPAAAPVAAGSVGMAASIGAAINSVGTAAVAQGSSLAAFGATALTLTGTLAILTTAALGFGAALGGIALGSFLNNLRIGSMRLKDWVDYFNLLWSGAEGAEKMAEDLKRLRESELAAADAAKAAAERQKQMMDEINRTPNKNATEWIEDYLGALKKYGGKETIEQLRGQRAAIEKEIEVATSQGVSPLIIDQMKGMVATVKQQLQGKEIKELQILLAQGMGLSKLDDEEARQKLRNIGLMIQSFSKDAIDAVPGLKELIDLINKIPKPPPAKDNAVQQAARAQMVKMAQEAYRKQPEVLASYLKGIGETPAAEIEGALGEAKRAAGRTADTTYAPAKLGAAWGNVADKTRAAATAAREYANSLKGWIGTEEMEKLALAVSQAGGASKMTEEQILKIGEDLARARAHGQPLSNDLKKVADEYYRIAGAKAVASAKGWVDTAEIEKMEGMLKDIDLSKLSPEVVMKLGEAFGTASQRGQEFSGRVKELAELYREAAANKAVADARGWVPTEEIEKMQLVLSKLDFSKLTDEQIVKLAESFTQGSQNGQKFAKDVEDMVARAEAASLRMAKVRLTGGMSDAEIKAYKVQAKALSEALAGGLDPTKIPTDVLKAEIERISKALQSQPELVTAEERALMKLAETMDLTGDATRSAAQALEAWSAAAASLGPTSATLARQMQDLYKGMQSRAMQNTGGATKNLGGLNLGELEAYGTKVREILNNAEQMGIGPRELALEFEKAGIPATALADIMAEYARRGERIPPTIAKGTAALAEAAMKQAKAAESAQKWASALSGLVQLAAMLGDGLGEVAQTIANTTGAFKEIGRMESGDDAYWRVWNQTKNKKLADQAESEAKRAKLMAKIAATAAAVGQIGRMLDKGTGNQMLAAKTMQGAAAGAQMGAVAGPWGAAAGAVIGGLMGFLKGSKLKKDAKEAGKALGMEVSQELAQKIQETAKELKVSIKVAALLNLDEAMAESKKAANTFAPQVAAIMKGIADGSIPAKEGLEQVGQAFTKIADEAIKAGRVGDAAMVALIKQARAQKIDVPEIKAFVNEQLDLATEGFHKYVAAVAAVSMSHEAMVDAANEAGQELAEDAKSWGDLLAERLEQGLISQEQFDKAIAGIKELGKTSGTVFGAMFTALAAEKGIVGAVDALAGDFETLKESLTSSLGEEMTNQILGPFAAAFDTINNEHLRPLFEGIDGLSQAMKGLANAGYLSTDQFSAMQKGITTMFDQAVAGGADMHTALLAVSPAIQAAISAAEQFGVPLDADTQRLKELAEQNGITFKTDPMKAMLDVLVEIAKVMGADIPESVKRMQASIDSTKPPEPPVVSPEGVINEEQLKENARIAADQAREEAGGGFSGSRAAIEAYIETLRTAGQESIAIIAENAQAAVAAAQQAGTGMTASAAASIEQMAAAAAKGSVDASILLRGALASGQLAVGDLANDPAWATLIAQLSSDVPGAAQAAAAAIAAIADSVPGSIDIPVTVTQTPAPPPEPEPTPEQFAGGTQGWRYFGGGTRAVLHGTEAVVRPGDVAPPGLRHEQPTITNNVTLAISENPMQTAQTAEQMRRFTLKTAERELTRNLTDQIASGRA